MELPLQITFHNMERTPEMEAIVRSRAEKMDKYADHIMSCRVVVDTPHRRHRRGNHYQVRIDLKLAGSEIVCNREPPEHSQDEDIAVALRDAFDSARRQMEDYVRLRRGFVKTHQQVPHARVIKLFPVDGYGVIATSDGREVYFRRRNVLNDGFDLLEIGSEVAFSQEEGAQNLQASTVTLLRR
jgi:cold shock CspA family protein/ribosome-associated translation inhibitor RaiA